MNWLPDHYKVPLFIVENGFGAYDTKHLRSISLIHTKERFFRMV